MEDVNEVLTRAQTTVGNEDANEDMMVEACAQNSEPVVLTSDVTFDGFEKMYNKVLEVEDQLLCPTAQAQAGDGYSEMKNSFEIFQRKLRQVMLEEKRKRVRNMHQLTIHTYLNCEPLKNVIRCKC